MGLGVTVESVELVAELKPRIVVIDAQLSHGAGIEVLRRVKSFVPPPRVIMTASSPYSQYRRQCLRNGADQYFQIPEEIEQLSNLVFELAERSSANDG
jgi:DNA-binding NarL/FixJ family response regulator